MSHQVFDYQLVDVFAQEALSGNGLAVFLLHERVPTQLLQKITQEMRQFESIYLWATHHPRVYRARIFTMEEELDFAGHPLIGAASTLHRSQFGEDACVQFQFALDERVISVTSHRMDAYFYAEMDQGPATFFPPIGSKRHEEVLSALNLSTIDLMEGLPLQVVSTGLPYLIVPIRSGLSKARIATRDFESLLAWFGAKFVYVLDVLSNEGRTWDNFGQVEDIATGSAAGPAGAYLVAHGRERADIPLVIHQGRFAGRPSDLTVVVSGTEPSRVRVSGGVVAVGCGHLTIPDEMCRYETAQAPGQAE